MSRLKRKFAQKYNKIDSSLPHSPTTYLSLVPRPRRRLGSGHSCTSLLAVYGIVRNKAAEKAKHAHSQQQEQDISTAQGSVVSVITHAGSGGAVPLAGDQPTTGGSYSINGILGIDQVELHAPPAAPHPPPLKRKRHEDQDENRDFNSHSEDDVKRQRGHYNGDQLYSNVSAYLDVLHYTLLLANAHTGS
ncbi:hypothetical protein EVAR_41533_1 [Eumeta japonica]|uniref:Uncharacterized protein n=1 Tax=Eumeta variegata TaxID=151549 RepID=A0A4C1X400_EUMVA|nr:hypothetical protein EVAR_41533_1 [Eumeta japonica]